MASPLFNLTGLSSGLDTNSIIEGLMSVERNPLVLLNQRRAAAQQRVDAWSQMTTRVSALRTAVDELKTSADFDDLVTTRSSNPDVVEATSTGAATPGSVTFTVDQLAAHHQLVGASSFASEAATVGAGTLSITVAGVETRIDTTAGTTVANLAAQINARGSGVTAQVVRTDASAVRLVLSAGESGADRAFTATGTQSTLAGFDVAQQGSDARVTVGSGAGALAVTRPTNQINDFLSGVEIKLGATTSTPVTIGIERDVDGAVSTVKGFVDEVNNVMRSIKELSAYDPEAKRGGPLLGDSTLRSLQSQLVGEVTGLIPALGTGYNHASALGIGYTTEGVFELDETRLRSALDADFGSVGRFFARSGQAADARLGYGFASDKTTPGSYGVVVTQAATVASTVGSAYTAPGGDIAFSITNGTVTADVTVGAGSSLESAVAAVNAALDAQGISSLRATTSGGALALNQLRYGSAGSFTVSGSGALGLDGSHTAVDVAGTIDGVAAVGNGQSLLADSGAAHGLGVVVSATAGEIAAAGGSLDLGTIAYSRGLMGGLSALLDRLEGPDGTLARASKQYEATIDDIRDRTAAFEDRLALRETVLRRQFTAMEQALAGLQGQMSFLGGLVR